MTKPLTLDPYIHTTLMRDLVARDRKPACFLLYLWIAMEEQRTGHAVEASYASLGEATGLSRSTVQASASWLLQCKLLSVEKKSATSTPVYQALKPWTQRRR